MKTCVMVLDVRTADVVFRTGGAIYGVPSLRWREMDKAQARTSATREGERFGRLLDYRPVNVKGRRFAFALVDRTEARP